ncbi:MAG: YggT family protein [Deltaproteobacteria bacterium]|nr:YggT family protein [Deltaproteobacteria bacterium]
MALLGFLLSGVAGVLGVVINAIFFLIIIRVILSWVSADPRNRLVQAIYSSTDPLLEPLRRRIPPLGMLDVSPIVLLLVLYFLEAFLVGSMKFYAAKLIQSSVA